MYKEKNNKELIELLEMHDKLTFQAQLNLRTELSIRKLEVNTSDLEDAINTKVSEIENLDYLKDIGFESEKDGKSIKITRTNKAVLLDVTAIILGIIFCYIGLIGISGVINLFSNGAEFNIVTLIWQLVMVSIGYLGIKLLGGIKRLIDYSGFEFLNNKGNITLKKRFDTKLVEIQKDESLLELEKQSEYLSLKLENDEVFKANSSSIIQKMTLSELAGK